MISGVVHQRFLDFNYVLKQYWIEDHRHFTNLSTSLLNIFYYIAACILGF